MVDKERDLKQKLFMKQSLKKIKDSHQMGLLENFQGYITAVRKAREEFFANPITATTNILNVVMALETLSLKQKNKIFVLHNDAAEDQIYGSRLYEYCS